MGEPSHYFSASPGGPSTPNEVRLSLPEGGLRLLPWVLELSWAVRRTILTNLLWAFGYNSIGLALAVSGQLQPVIAAVLMAGSSLLVVMNSLRLERFGPVMPLPELAARNVETGAPPDSNTRELAELPARSP